MRLLSIITYMLAVVSLISCHGRSGLSSENTSLAAEKIQALRDIPLSPASIDSLQLAWIRLDSDPVVMRDTILFANVKYNLARIYAMKGQDSARIVVEQALKLIEPVEGSSKYKALIYNGVGNIRSMEAKEREASFYYNKAAAIVLSDTSAALSADAASSILLSAAQSNLLFFQYHLAEQMNRAALPLVDSLPQGHVNRQRVLVQMINTLDALHQPIDSVARYLHQLEDLHARNPKEYDVSFFYESKIKYFEMAKQIDSLLHYQLLKTALDDKVFRKRKTAISVGNLIVDYTNVASAYVLLKQANNAKRFIEKAKMLKESHQEIIYNDIEIYYQKSLAGLYELQGRNHEALRTLNYAFNLQKEIYQTDNTKAVTEMNSLYQLQLKDVSIKTLNERIKVNQLELQQNRLWLAVMGLGALLLSLLLFLLYYTFRRRRQDQQREKVLLQQQLLRTQMEPHFIFNTLSAVQSFVRLDRKEEAIEYLNRFSRLLRSSLELSRENLVPLEEEIQALQNYLSLQQMRFDGAFAYRIEQPEDLETDIILLPPMLIQPYVENAILHGVDLESAKGSIEVLLELSEDILRVSVRDSGNSSGIKREKAHRSLSGTIGRERIDLLGKKANVEILTGADGGTVVILSIPVVFG